MEQTTNANDLQPGDRVVLRTQKSKHGPAAISFTFERYHNRESLLEKLARPDTVAIPGQWDKALNCGRRLAAFRVGKIVGLFSVDDEGRLWDEEDREIEILRKESQ